MSFIDLFWLWKVVYSVAMKTKELTLQEILSVPCLTCGAATAEPCELHSGALRREPHRDRRLSAAEAVKRSPSKQHGQSATPFLQNHRYPATD
jgi:hypothetical protein